jgi:photosystem II stability/assembly factor-like uncharacterized protein
MKKPFTIIFLLFASLLINVKVNADWVEQTNPVTTDLFGAWAVNNDVCWISGVNGVVIRTTNGGAVWSLANNGLPSQIGFYTICALSSDICWTGAENGSLWRTTNGGVSWDSIPLNPTNPFIDVIHFFNANLGFIIADPSGGMWRYYITTNGGATWTLGANAPAAIGNEASYNNSYCALDTAHIWFGTNNSQIYRGSFRGPFTGVPTTGAVNTYGVAFNNPINGTASVVNSSYEVLPNMISTNGGTSWTMGTYIAAGAQYGLKGVPGTDYMWMTGAGLFSGHVLRSTDNGVWFDTEFTFQPGNAGGCISMVNINCGWTATVSTESGINGGRIYKYTNNIGVVNNGEIPSEFKLGQNSPNPFNPTTKIKFDIGTPLPPFSKGGIITLKIYDALGKDVATLVNEELKPGTYKVDWNASDLPSGIYFYRLDAGSFSETRKMILLK